MSLEAASSAADEPAPDGMRWIAAGDFWMGSNSHYPEERPVRRVAAAGFWIDRTPVTNRQFSAFVAAEEYVTLAERSPDRLLYPEADPALLVPGSAVFSPPTVPVSLEDEGAWWSYVPGSCWRHPDGPDSSLAGRSLHPVAHVAYEDALAYAHWAGKELPTEAEWEYAARGGLDGAPYAWGDELNPDGRWLANTWQGDFPYHDSGADGFVGRSPVGAFPPNGYGLFDMIGNVWEWTSSLAGEPSSAPQCCAPGDGAGRGSPVRERRFIKGGSYLCAPGYCARYRPAARQALDVDSTTGHVGFRCIVRGAA